MNISQSGSYKWGRSYYYEKFNLYKNCIKIYLDNFINKLVFCYFRSCGKKDKDDSKEKVAVKSVSFTVPKGQVFGLLGKKNTNYNSTQSGE